MKRNMELVRTLLLYVEVEHKGDDFLDVDVEGFEGFDQTDVYGHLDILIDAGLLKDHHQRSDITALTNGLTWEGHDFVDSVRDDEVWRKTKEAAEHAKGWTFGIISDLAKGLIKTKIKQHTGVEF